jgi:hypothetical protein
MELKARIEQLLSEILSDKYECVVRLRFEPKQDGETQEGEKQNEPVSA